jgi:hypothetical protein
MHRVSYRTVRRSHAVKAASMLRRQSRECAIAAEVMRQLLDTRSAVEHVARWQSSTYVRM